MYKRFSLILLVFGLAFTSAGLADEIPLQPGTNVVGFPYSKLTKLEVVSASSSAMFAEQFWVPSAAPKNYGALTPRTKLLSADKYNAAGGAAYVIKISADVKDAKLVFEGSGDSAPVTVKPGYNIINFAGVPGGSIPFSSITINTPGGKSLPLLEGMKSGSRPNGDEGNQIGERVFLFPNNFFKSGALQEISLTPTSTESVRVGNSFYLYSAYKSNVTLSVNTAGEGEPPISSKAWKVPVLEIRYFPTTPDGQRIDKSVTSDVDDTLSTIRAKCARITNETMVALEEGSRFRSYKNSQTKASLDYQVVQTLEYLEPVPMHPTKKYLGKKLPDYNAIMSRVDVRKYVEGQGVKEVWIWGYHPPDAQIWESNLASPHGDVSNSDLDPSDLPILAATYTVYHYNYSRETDEAVHNHGHQIERLMAANGAALWDVFQGAADNWRCGNVHFPPNGRFDYDYDNPTTIQSDIEDWKPDGFGEMKALNSSTWGSRQLNWLVYWMKSIPGEDNGLTFKGRSLTNWWQFVGNYDAVKTAGGGLVQ